MQHLFIYFLSGFSSPTLCLCFSSTVYLPDFFFFFLSLCMLSFYLCFRIYLLLQFVSFSVKLLQFVSFVRQTVFLPALNKREKTSRCLNISEIQKESRWGTYTHGQLSNHVAATHLRQVGMVRMTCWIEIWAAEQGRKLIPLISNIAWFKVT